MGDTRQRMLFYWSRLYVGQLASGADYYQLAPTISVNVLNFVELPGEDYHSVFTLRRQEDGYRLIEDLELHFLELPKMRALKRLPRTPLEKWLFYLNNAEGETMDQIAKEVPMIQKARTVEELFMQMEHDGPWQNPLFPNHPATYDGPPIGASAVNIPLPSDFHRDMIRPLTIPEIEDITQKYINAAERAQKAGFDGVSSLGIDAATFFGGAWAAPSITNEAGTAKTDGAIFNVEGPVGQKPPNPDFVLYRAVIENDIDARRPGVISAQIRFTDLREERVRERVRELLTALHMRRLREVDCRLRRDVGLDLRQSTDMIEVVVGDNDVLDVRGRAADFLERLEHAGPRAHGARIDQRNVVFDQQVRLRTARAHLEDSG